MRALGFEPKKEEIKKMIADIDKEGTGKGSATMSYMSRCYIANFMFLCSVVNFDFFHNIL